MKFMHMVLDQSLDLAFPFSFNLESSRPSQIGFFFAWEASWGKLLMLINLKGGEEHLLTYVFFVKRMRRQ